MAAKIGFETYSEEGPGIFLSRLKDALVRMGRFDEENPDVWIQLSFKTLPDRIAQRRAEGKTRVIVRMDGAYCAKHFYFDKGVVIPVPFLDEFESRRTNRKKNARIRQNLLDADDIIFQSDFSRRITQQFVVETPPGKLIYNGVPLDEFTPEGPKAELGQDGAVKILMSHSFRPYHRLHDAMRILGHLNFINPKQRYHLFILGGDEGKSFDYARGVAAREKLEEGRDFTFLGKRPYNELASVYRGSDMMLNLSYWDTCPNVVIEAMACGLPVVGVGHGGVKELVEQEGGILVSEDIPFTWIPHTDFERMPKAPAANYADAIMKMEAAREAYGRSAREAAQERFDIRMVAEQYALAADHLNPAVVVS